MRHARLLRSCAASILGYGFLTACGCSPYYYYGYPAPVCCEPAPVTTYGNACTVPGQGTVVSQAPTTVAGGLPRARRVLTSEARDSDGIPIVRNGSGFRWRRSDPESVATTRVEGAVSDDSVNR